MADDDFKQREQQHQSSLGSFMGDWMTELSDAEIKRQVSWVDQMVRLGTPDKNGNLPMVTIHSGVTGDDGKAISGADMSFPLVFALLGSQFAAKEAEYETTMTVSSKTHEATSADEKEKVEGHVDFGWGVVSGGTSFSVQAAEHQEKSRDSDYRNRTNARLVMERVQPPEPVMRLLDAFQELVGAEIDEAKKYIADHYAQRAADGKTLIDGAATPVADDDEQPPGDDTDDQEA